jgi:hypothetical protein
VLRTHYFFEHFFLPHLTSFTSYCTSSSELTPKSLAVPSKAFWALKMAVVEALFITTSSSLRSKKMLLSHSFNFSFLRISTGTVTCPFADTFARFIKTPQE